MYMQICIWVPLEATRSARGVRAKSICAGPDIGAAIQTPVFLIE